MTSDKPKPPTIVIVEDHPISREGLKRHLEEHGRWDVLAVADDGGLAVERIREIKPDLCLTDIRMPTLGGLELVKALRRASPATTIVLISGFADVDVASECLAAGARAYCSKTRSQETIESVMSLAYQGLFVVDQQTAPESSGQLLRGGSRLVPLTKRETEVLTLVADDLRNDEVAERLGITLPTVKNHLSSVYTKLSVRTRGEAVNRARDEGVI
jgi:DNA-binding NarL/FixJ family response regulator